ncbi:hypothetical protein TNCV_2298971 [Trichonephila clavipes]|nr:hypothetical protein TNCV_2298971 [Trichonephila clavipes]
MEEKNMAPFRQSERIVNHEAEDKRLFRDAIQLAIIDAKTPTTVFYITFSVTQPERRITTAASPSALSEEEAQDKESSALRFQHQMVSYAPGDLVLDESRSFFRVHTGYFSDIQKCIKAGDSSPVGDVLSPVLFVS